MPKEQPTIDRVGIFAISVMEEFQEKGYTLKETIKFLAIIQGQVDYLEKKEKR